jgi:hypothetical protein
MIEDNKFKLAKEILTEVTELNKSYAEPDVGWLLWD